MTARPRVYLAGPEVFLPDALAVGAEKCRLAAAAGFEGVFPLDATLDLTGLPPAEQATRIALANEGLMRSCDALVANLTPFRGASMDAGTAFEVGFMRSLGRPVAGYTNAIADYAGRSRALRDRGAITGDCDREDVAIEEFGLAENLMLEIAIRASGCRIVRTDVAQPRRMQDLTGFAACLGQLQGLFPGARPAAPKPVG